MPTTSAYHDPVYDNDREAMRVLDLIVAEFESDPMSVQCFDLRIVQRAKDCVQKQREWERVGKLPPLLTEGHPKRGWGPPNP